MPYKDPEAKRAYSRAYRQRHQQKLHEHYSEYAAKHRRERYQRNKRFYERRKLAARIIRELGLQL